MTYDKYMQELRELTERVRKLVSVTDEIVGMTADLRVRVRRLESGKDNPRPATELPEC